MPDAALLLGLVAVCVILACVVLTLTAYRDDD